MNQWGFSALILGSVLQENRNVHLFYPFGRKQIFYWMVSLDGVRAVCHYGHNTTIRAILEIVNRGDRVVVEN